MDRTVVLCNKDRRLLNEFSRRCVSELKNSYGFRSVINIFSDFMDANVGKEIEKDRLIIEHTAAAFDRAAGRPEIDAEYVFEKTVHVDHEFVKSIAVLPLLLHIRYDEIKDIREERISLISSFIVDLLGKWEGNMSFSEAVIAVFGRKKFEGIINEMLRLYNMETRALANSVSLLPPLNIAKDMFADVTLNVMERIRIVISAEFAGMVYGGSCTGRT